MHILATLIPLELELDSFYAGVHAFNDLLLM